MLILSSGRTQTQFLDCRLWWCFRYYLDVNRRIDKSGAVYSTTIAIMCHYNCKCLTPLNFVGTFPSYCPTIKMSFSSSTPYLLHLHDFDDFRPIKYDKVLSWRLLIRHFSSSLVFSSVKLTCCRHCWGKVGVGFSSSSKFQFFSIILLRKFIWRVIRFRKSSLAVSLTYSALKIRRPCVIYGHHQVSILFLSLVANAMKIVDLPSLPWPARRL